MKNLFQKYLIIYLAIVLVSVSFVGGLMIGQRTKADSGEGKVVNMPEGGDRPAYLSQDVDFDLLGEIWKQIKENYVDREKVTDSQMFYGALSGVVASLGDQHSIFFDPKTTQEFSQELQGNFEGIGAEIGVKNNQLVVVSPLPGTPAYEAGLKAGDKILAIDGKATGVMSLDGAVSLIRGPKGTKVVLTILRDDWEESKDIEITRDEIHFDSVSWKFRDDGLVYIEVASFNDDTMKLFNDAVRGILVKNPKGIILDLRGNPGGYLNEAIDMTSEWVLEGPVVLEAYDGKQIPYNSNGKARLKDYPTVVLVNGGSASGSEIVAGALQDYKKATLIGTQTFGKGSVQKLIMLSNGSSLKLTIARWLTPDGRQIDKVGIAPDVVIERTEEEYNADIDVQLDKAVETLLGK